MSNKKVWLITILILGVAVAGYFLFPQSFMVYTICWVLLIGIILWRGNRYIWLVLDQKFPWGTYGKKRFFIHLLLGYLLLVLVINGSYFALRYFVVESQPNLAQIITTNVLGLVVFIPSFSMYFSLQFLNFWRKSQLDMEQYQKESLRSELKNLKNHLDPHFLFNNLNILSSLIDKGPDHSKPFLTRFAQVYRKMLQSSSEDLVPLEEELDFIDAYVYLLKTRFADAILVKTDVAMESRDRMLPPLALQMLVENAVKHNIASAEQPLKIDIVSTPHEISVSNSINLKEEDLRTKSGTGLKNIKDRIAYFSNQEISISQEENRFIVSVPLIEIEEI